MGDVCGLDSDLRGTGLAELAFCGKAGAEAEAARDQYAAGRLGLLALSGTLFEQGEEARLVEDFDAELLGFF